MHHPTDRITHTTVFVTPVVEHWLEREIAQWVHHEGSTHRTMSERSYQEWYYFKLQIYLAIILVRVFFTAGRYRIVKIAFVLDLVQQA